MKTTPQEPFIAQHHSAKTNKLLQDQLDLLRNALAKSDSEALEYKRAARWANIFAIVANIIATYAAIIATIEWLASTHK